MERHLVELERGRRQSAAAEGYARANEIAERDLVTRSGVTLHVRPAHPGDEPALADFFLQVTPEDLYHRFLTGLNRVDETRLARITQDDDPNSVSVVALEEPTGKIVATATLTIDPHGDMAEFALCTRADKKHRGVSWALLDHIVSYAQALGIGEIRSIQSWDDVDALQLEREMGFDVHPCPQDSTLTIAEMELQRAFA